MDPSSQFLRIPKCTADSLELFYTLILSFVRKPTYDDVPKIEFRDLGRTNAVYPLRFHLHRAVICTWPWNRGYYATVATRRPRKSTIHGQIIPLEQSQRLGPSTRVSRHAHSENMRRVVTRISQTGTTRLATGPQDVPAPQSRILIDNVDNGWHNSRPKRVYLTKPLPGHLSGPRDI